MKSATQHVIPIHNQLPIISINEESDQDTKRKFTYVNSVMSDDTFMNPFNNYSRSEEYHSCSDWDSDSSCRSIDSLRDDMVTFFDTPTRPNSQFILPGETEHGS